MTSGDTPYSRRAIVFGGLATLALPAVSLAGPALVLDPKQKLAEAYPDFIHGVGEDAVIWRDGSRVPWSDGRAKKTFEERLADASLEDQMSIPYRLGPCAASPGINDDPGRMRNIAFFKKMYGANEAQVRANLVSVPWRLGQFAGSLPFTRANDVDRIAAQIVDELSDLPSYLQAYLAPPSGSFSWRMIAGTNRLSPHAFGIAIDINTRLTEYWRWSGERHARKTVPFEIVDVFERHGFIWGGKWYHFDTMHFEYRPELVSRSA